MAEKTRRLKRDRPLLILCHGAIIKLKDRRSAELAFSFTDGYEPWFESDILPSGEEVVLLTKRKAAG